MAETFTLNIYKNNQFFKNPLTKLCRTFNELSTLNQMIDQIVDQMFLKRQGACVV